MSVIKTALVSLILSWLPVSDPNIKMHLGLLISELMNDRYFNWFRSIWLLCKKKQITIPDQTKDKDFNPLFDKVQDYLTVKYSKLIESCELVPKYGDIDFSIRDMTGKKFNDSFTDNGVNHDLELQIEEIEDQVRSRHSRSTYRQIVISSKTATPENIKTYIKKISSVQLKSSNIIKVFRPIIHGKKKEDRTVEWESILVKTNKTLQNTIYSQEIQKQLFDDIDMFMINEESYAKKGIPYKRGYFLYSSPGQGKTSVAKIIANKYNTPIFCLDLTTINDNPTLIKLMTELNYYTNQEKYILLIEDAERAEFFNPRYRDPSLSMDCFLNVLDGVVEPHGRIILMSANNPECILENKAMMRPGRIDKILELKSCNKYQIQKMYELFYANYEQKIDWDNWEFDQDLSAAYIMKLLQENSERPDIFIRLIGDNKTRDMTDVTLDDTFKKALDQVKTDKEENMHRNKLKYRKSSKIEDRVRNAKRKLKRAETRKSMYEQQVEKTKTKLPNLLEKLKEKQEKEKLKKLRDKAKRRRMYEEKKLENDKLQNELEEYFEEEYETPVFMLNSIELDNIPEGTVTTYEEIE